MNAPAPPAVAAPAGDEAADYADLMERGCASRAAGDHAAALGFLRAALAQRPREAWALMSVADTLRDLGRHDEADDACRAMLAEHPGHAGALVALGRSIHRRGDPAGALPLFRAALERKPPLFWIYTALAEALRDLGRHEEAEEACRAAVAAEPENVGALTALGRALQRRGDAAGALPLFQAVLAQRPRTAWALMAVAEALRDLGRHDEADEVCHVVLADDPGHVGALLALGHTANGRADRQAAAAWFRRAAQAKPDAPAPRLALADALRNLGDLDAATEAAKAVLARDPAHVEGWMSLGHTERRAGRRDSALRAFARASELRPDNPRPLVEMALEERRLGRPDASERLLRRALEIDGGDAETLLRLGEHLRLADKPEEALEMFRRSTASPRPSPWAFVAASQTLVELGELDAALLALDHGGARLGARPELAAKRADLLRRTGDWAGARAVTEEAALSWPRHFGVWFERARLELVRGGPDGLAAHLREVPAGATPQEQARVHILHGLLAADQWRFEEAKGHHARAIALNPDDGWPRTCLAQMRLLTLDIDGAREELQALSRLGVSSAKLQGRSTNISQTHLGQLLDEFVLDREALDELRGLQGLVPTERIGPLLAMVKRHPDYTPAAIDLVLALRRSGRLAQRPGATTGAAASRIPRTFAQYWDDTDPPRDLAGLMASWGKLYPRFALRRFSDGQARAFLARFHAADVQAAYRRSRQPAQKADIFRLAYLHTQGGFYADADDRLVGDLEDLRFPGAGLVLYQEDIGTIGNNLIGAAPGHPLIGRALRLAVEAVNRGDSDILWLSTGPGMLTRAFAGLLAEPGRAPLAALDDAVVLEHGELQRTVSIHCLVGYKSTDRHWSRTAFGRRTAGAGRSAPRGQKADQNAGIQAAARVGQRPAV